MSGQKRSNQLSQGTETRGRKKLLAWMAADPKVRTQGFVAKQLGVSQPAVSGWLKGKPRPDDDSRALIAALTRDEVAAEDWETREERRERLRNLERAREASKGAA